MSANYSKPGVLDVSAYILSKVDGSISTMKLQKLAYFSQGWSLGLRGVPIFEEKFQAWRYGPVCFDLYKEHRGRFQISEINAGNPGNLAKVDQIIVDAVLKQYGALSGLALSDLTHATGTPWSKIRDRDNLRPNDPSSAEIPTEVIREFFRKAFEFE